MKTILLAATFLCFVNLTNGQAGRLDPSFGKNGIVKTDLGKSYGYSSSGTYVLAHPDGSIFLIAQTGTSSLVQGFITKRHPDGSIDSSYGHSGFSENVTMAPYSAILQADGKIVVAGSINRLFNGYDIVIARFDPNGSLDSSFSDDGIQSNFSFGASVHKPVVVKDDEKIVVCAGFATARYNLNGSPDSTFNTTGIVYDNFDYEIVLAHLHCPSGASLHYRVCRTPCFSYSLRSGSYLCPSPHFIYYVLRSATITPRA